MLNRTATGAAANRLKHFQEGTVDPLSMIGIDHCILTEFPECCRPTGTAAIFLLRRQLIFPVRISAAER